MNMIENIPDEQLIQFEPPEERQRNLTQMPGWEILLGTDGESGRYSMQAKNKAILLMLVALAIVVAVLIKKIKYLHKVVQFVPESGIIMVLGIFVTLVCHLFGGGYQVTIYGWVIEHVMIAPIILHASYCLFHPHFFGQLGTILTLAVFATVLNCLITAGLVYAWIMSIEFLNMMTGYQVLMFSALISAVDPVAVLAVFDTVGANRALYYLVFGESLLNDGVTFVMYQGFKVFTVLSRETAAEVVEWDHYGLLMLSFITKPVCGIIIGFVNGLTSSFFSKFSTEKSDFLQPLLNLLFAAQAYIMAIMFGFSGILSLIAFGLTQQRYTFRNITNTAVVKTRNVVRGFAMVSELFLFFILGSEFAALDFANIINFAFIVLAVMTLARIIVTGLCCFVGNKMTRHQINWKWQILLIVGGMRGAIAYAMVIQYKGRPFADVFYGTTVFLIFVTTVVNGMLAKPLVSILQLKEEGQEHDYDHEYGWDNLEKLGRPMKYFKSFEEKVILPFCTKDHRTMEVAANEVIESEEESIFDRLEKKHMNKYNKKKKSKK